jgi:hypothetical protein
LKTEKRNISMTLNNTPFLFLLLSIATSVSVVRGAVSLSQCDGQPCVEEFSSSCADIAYEYDFSGECCVLTDSDDGSGGCTLTVYDGGCNKSERTNPCGGPEPFVFTCVGGSSVGYSATNAGECPAASDYDVLGRTHRADGEILPALTMTLTGPGLPSVNSFTRDEMLAEWNAITVSHTVTFFEDNPDLGVFDVMTYIILNIDSGQVDEELVLTYFQYLVWRSSPDDEAVDGSFMIEEAFTSEAGKAAYLASLQASDIFADELIAVSSVAVLTPEGFTPLPTVPTLDTIAPTTTPDMPTDPPSASGGDEETSGTRGDEETSAPGSDEESSALMYRLSGLLISTSLLLFLWQ